MEIDVQVFSISPDFVDTGGGQSLFFLSLLFLLLRPCILNCTNEVMRMSSHNIIYFIKRFELDEHLHYRWMIVVVIIVHSL